MTEVNWQSENNSLRLCFGLVSNKQLQTPNDFVSHMIEHIAWRLGLQIFLKWENNDWHLLGRILGESIAKLKRQGEECHALGMIDDGAAQCSVYFDKPSELEFTSTSLVNLDEFISIRCEQLESGSSLIDLLSGISEGLNAKIYIKVFSFEDPHHTWEAIFRALGIALSKVFTPRDLIEQKTEELDSQDSLSSFSNKSEIKVLEVGLHRAVVQRGTAESGVQVSLDFKKPASCVVKLEVGESISGALLGIEKLFELLSSSLGACLNISFKAKYLSSSHVVFEDIGLVFGRAMLEIIKLRMSQYGVNGAGLNLDVSNNMLSGNIKISVSIEGRKYLRILPEDGDMNKLRKSLLLGKNIVDHLRSEDLDDFLDGLSGGLSASIMILVQDYSNADKTWQQIFEALGLALKEAFSLNPYRLGVSAGVKACLS